jgi:glycosyltransferase involved in cell wall biosynthesis
MVTLSIVTSVYNEEDIVEKFLGRLLAVRIPDAGVEFVVVDNGSTDGTHAILERLAKKHGFNLITNPSPSKGLTHGVITGIRAAKGDYVCIIRSDFQEDPDDIPPVFAKMRAEGLGHIIGWRKDRHDPFPRLVTAFLYVNLVRLLHGFKLPDINGAPRIFKAEYFKNYEFQSRGIIIDVETLWRVRKKGGKLGFAVVRHYPRTTGNSFVKPGTVLEIFADLMDFTLKAWFSKD